MDTSLNNYYTKESIDNSFIEYTKTNDLYTRNQIDNSFTEYTKTIDLYTNTQIDNSFVLKSVFDASLSNYYTKEEIDNSFIEYTKTIDLYTNTQIDNSFVLKSVLDTSLSNYYIKEEIDNFNFISSNTTTSLNTLTLTGPLNGPATFVIDPAGVGDNTGMVIIRGGLQVDGSSTIINSSKVDISDHTILLASNAPNEAATNGAGIEISGNNYFKYKYPENIWESNIDISANITGNAETVTNGIYTTSSVTALSDVTSVGSGAIITSEERIKLSSIEISANLNVQADFNETDSTLDSFILNKPVLFSGNYNDLTGQPTLFSGNYNDLSGQPTNIVLKDSDASLNSLDLSENLTVKKIKSKHGEDLILEVSGNGNILFKEYGVTYNLTDLSNIKNIEITELPQNDTIYYIPLSNSNGSSGNYTIYSGDKLRYFNEYNILDVEGGTLSCAYLNLFYNQYYTNNVTNFNYLGEGKNIIGGKDTIFYTDVSFNRNVDINGGSIDGTTIGANSAAAGSFTTINASSTITGNLTGNVTGDLYGNAATSNKIVSIENENIVLKNSDASLNNLDISGNLKISNGNIDISHGIINFFASDEQLLGPDTGIAQKVQDLSNSVGDLSNNLLTANNDASFNNVDICGNLKVNGQTQNSKVFMRLNTATPQTGNITEQTIETWNTTDIISNPAGLYTDSSNIFSPPRSGYYSINFQTSMESTTTNSVNAKIKLYQTDISGTESLVCHSHESEGFDFYLKWRFLSLNIILFINTTDTLRIAIQGDNGYRMPASPYTNLSIHNVD